MKVKDQISSNPATGTVYFMRSTGWNMTTGSFNTFIDGELACKLNNNRYSIHQLPEGTHQFSVQFMGKKSKEKIQRIDLNIQAGKTYYLQLIYEHGALLDKLYLEEVTESTAKRLMGRLEEDKKCL
jgi:hypothetical protein